MDDKLSVAASQFHRLLSIGRGNKFQKNCILPSAVNASNVASLRRPHQAPDPIGRLNGVGRGKVLQQLLASGIAKKGFIGTSGSYKNIICNGILCEFHDLFEYSVSFKPEVSFEYCSELLHDSISQPFIIYKCSVFTPKELRDDDQLHEYKKFVNHELITMTLRLNAKIRLETRPELLQTLLDDVGDNSAAQQSKYIASIRQCKLGQVLYINRHYYNLQAKTISELMAECVSVYGENHREALSVYVNRARIYYERDRKVYRLIKVEWQSQKLKICHARDYKLVDPCDCRIVTNANRSDSPMELMDDIKMFATGKLFDKWKFRLSNDFVRAKARVLEPESVIFGDDVVCTPTCGSWWAEMRENEVRVSVDLVFWIVFYTDADEALTQTFVNRFRKLQDDTGMKIGVPLMVKIESETKDGYGNALVNIISEEVQLIVVIVPESDNKPHVLIEYICCLLSPVPYRIVPVADATNPLKIHELAIQICAVLGGSPWSIRLPYTNWMVCGADLQHPHKDDVLPVCSFVANLGQENTQWYSKADFMQTDFKTCLKTWLLDTLHKYCSTNGCFPARIVIYQNCNEHTRARFRGWYKDFAIDEVEKELRLSKGKLDLCVILVRRDAVTCFYKDLRKGAQNVPPGTVVDGDITDQDSRDFFLMSHSSDDSIVRPTHYEVVDTCGLTPDELQTFTYKMCHLYYKQAKTSEMPAHCLYAQKLGVLVAEDIYDIPSVTLDEYLYYL